MEFEDREKGAEGGWGSEAVSDAEIRVRRLELDSRYCGYCGKRKRGWRAMEPNVCCFECERDRGRE